MSTSSNVDASLIVYGTVYEPILRGGKMSSRVFDKILIEATTVPLLIDSINFLIEKTLTRPGLHLQFDVIIKGSEVQWMTRSIHATKNNLVVEILDKLETSLQPNGVYRLTREGRVSIMMLGSVEVWQNQPTVVVTIVTTKDGLLMVRRGLKDGYGKLALPGGFQVVGETWQQAAAKEVLEETGLVINPDLLIERKVDTVGPNKDINLLFCEYPEVVDDFDINFDHEILEVLTINEPIETAFPAHTAQVKAYFDRLATKDQGDGASS